MILILFGLASYKTFFDYCLKYGGDFIVIRILLSLEY